MSLVRPPQRPNPTLERTHKGWPRYALNSLPLRTASLCGPLSSNVSAHVKHLASTTFLFTLSVLTACAVQPKPVPVAAEGTASTPAARLPTRDLSRVNGNVVRHVIGGQVYYYVRSPCCDLHNYLFASDGSYVCAPDGGFTGRGDGKCPAGIRIDHSDEVVVPNPFYKP